MNEFIDAINAKDFNTAGLLVWQASRTDVTLQECIDWCAEGSFDGTETASSVAAELDGLQPEPTDEPDIPDWVISNNHEV